MRRRALPVIGVVLALVATTVVALPAAAGNPARSEHQRIVDYWTAARMESARPHEMVLDRVGRSIKPLVTNSGGQSWPTGAAAAGGLIARVEGRVYFTLGTGNYVCSGTVVTDGRADSYRYSFSNRMYGPKFTAYTQAVYNAANAATSGTIAVP